MELPRDENWLARRHATYERMKDKWETVRLLSTGEYCNEEYVERFLFRRKQGEADGMYRDRKKNLDPDLLFANIQGKITGQFFEGESHLEITWAPEGAATGSLGDPADPESRAWQILNNTSGDGASFEVFKRRLFATLVLYERAYVLVLMPTEEWDIVRWIILEPEKVPDWQEEDGELVFVKIFHSRTETRSPREKAKTIHQYTIYTLEGMERWEVEAGKPAKEARLTEEMTYPVGLFRAAAGSARRRLPVVASVVPMKKNMSYLLARKAIAILNRESERDNILRIANLPRLIFKGIQSMWEKFKKAIKDGANTLGIGPEDDVSYTSPQTDSATLAGEVVTDKRRNINVSAFQSYEDEAREATATEIRQRERAGRIVLLNYFAAPFDSVIAQCFLLTEQIEHPQRPSRWGEVAVRRKGKFRPDETEEAVERDAAVFGASVPLTQVAFMQALRQQYQGRFPGADEDEDFETDAERLYREYRLRFYVEMGLEVEAAAPLSGFEGDALTMLTRRDFAMNGR